MVKNGKIFETFCNENGALPHAGRQIQSLRMKEREKKKVIFKPGYLFESNHFQSIYHGVKESNFGNQSWNKIPGQL